MHGKSAPRDNLDAQIEAVRQFNRFFTQRIGVLDESLLDSGLTLTQARVLYEIGSCDTCAAADLISLLRLDAGYLSRILQEFADSGWVKRKPSPEDGRRALLSLTPKGRKKFTELDRQSRRRIGELVSPLSEPQRTQLLRGMRTVQESLSVAPLAQERRVNIRSHRIGDIGWAIERHGQLYAAEFDWNEEFEALVATLFARFATQHDPAAERFWVAEVDGERVGCVFVVRSEKDRQAAQLRCLLVDPSGRGLGVGRRLVDECLQFSKAAGYRRIILWTNDVLVSARRIYEAAGFSLVEETAHRSFGHDLIGQYWSRDLNP
ncbi:MAG TPA: helix-turn-helix domain-containing GNAT family N-acetyltransferase [Xanthobacteraceae bacterium]|jgi:DNA-binding MarR family transcriptional regulator/N-acetylglutamate synthase-like GNAT family acetyltransferase